MYFGSWIEGFSSLCQVEVFNILFVKEQDNKFVVHCQDCAKKSHPRLEGFVVLNQYRLEDLINIYDNYTLRTPVSSWLFHFSI